MQIKLFERRVEATECKQSGNSSHLRVHSGTHEMVLLHFPGQKYTSAIPQSEFWSVYKHQILRKEIYQKESKHIILSNGELLNFYFQLDTKQGHLGRENLTWGMHLSDWPVGLFLGHLLYWSLRWEMPAHCGWFYPWAAGPPH